MSSMSDKMHHPVRLNILQQLQRAGITTDTAILVGVSGGMDSMVLLSVLSENGFQVTAAHVNYRLRGKDSDEDALLVERFCREHGIPFFLHESDIKAYALRLNLNTQLAARRIRYDWWNDLMAQHSFEFMLTAHHMDDAIETVFINLLRGTGINGLKGIPFKRDRIVRPLIGLTREEIESYVHLYHIPYRTDISNLEDQYQRNKIRHHLIPLMQEISPGFYARMRHSLRRIDAELTTWNYYFDQWERSAVKVEKGGYFMECTHHEIPFLLRWLERHQIPWNLAEDFIYAEGKSGNVLKYQGWILSKTSNGFFLEEVGVEEEISMTISGPGSYTFGDALWVIERCVEKPDVTSGLPNTVYVSGRVVQWPIIIRKRKDGDVFQPFGMDGQSKKLQDFFTDLKLAHVDKSRVWIVANPQHIIWVAGYRLDERARVGEEEKEIYCLSFGPVTED